MANSCSCKLFRSPPALFPSNAREQEEYFFVASVRSTAENVVNAVELTHVVYAARQYASDARLSSSVIVLIHVLCASRAASQFDADSAVAI